MSETREMNYNTHVYWVTEVMMQDCFGLADKLEWIKGDDQPRYMENGIRVRFRFTGLNENPGQFNIVTSKKTPLKADDIVIKAETILPRGTNLFYNPVPFEFLKTYEEKP